MREKYIEERFPRYYEFGKSKDGMVDVSSSNTDPVVTVTQEQANALIKDRDEIINMLVKVTLALHEADPKKLSVIWYGK
jgi:hypothetical protein